MATTWYSRASLYGSSADASVSCCLFHTFVRVCMHQPPNKGTARCVSASEREVSHCHFHPHTMIIIITAAPATSLSTYHPPPPPPLPPPLPPPPPPTLLPPPSTTHDHLQTKYHHHQKNTTHPAPTFPPCLHHPKQPSPCCLHHNKPPRLPLTEAPSHHRQHHQGKHPPH